MATILETRAREYYITDDRGHRALIPRSVIHPLTAQLLDYRTQRISSSVNYEAFPFTVKLGSSIVGIYSAGPAHAQSEQQIMFRTDDNGLTYQTAVFFDSISGAYDLSLLNGLLAVNDVVVLKAWYVQQTPLGPFVAVNGNVNVGGLNYALWSRAKPGPGGVLWRTGYVANGGVFQAALFESVDKGITWTFKIMLFQNASLSFNEVDFVNVSGSTWKFFSREDTNANNLLYEATSTDDGATIGAFAPMTIQGRQPCAIKITNGNIILAVGDRSGGGGFTTGGDYLTADDVTGIGVYRSSDGAAAVWSSELLIDRMFSTDGGQPMLNEFGVNMVHASYYSRRSLDTQPVVSSAVFNATIL